MRLIDISMLLIAILLTILIGGIATVLGWKSIIHKEKGLHDFELTSNGQSKWFMDSQEYKNSWLGIQVTGKYSGGIPRYGQVIYYRNKTINIPVLIYGVQKRDNQSLTLKLFGIRSKQLKPNGVFTNIRKSEQIRSIQKITKISYPIIVKRKWNVLLKGMMMSLIGTILLAGVIHYFEASFSYIFLLIISGLLLYVGGMFLYDYFTFNVEITENNQLIFWQKGRKKHYRINELVYSITKSNEKQYLIIILDPDRRELLRIDSQDRNGLVAYQVIKEAIQLKHTEELYRSLLAQSYYLPLTEEGFIIEHHSENENEKRINIFDSEELLEKVIDYFDLAGNEVVSLEETVELIKNFSLVQEIRIVKKDDRGEVYYYTITKKIWEEMKNLGKVS